ncbi:hypothetical protein JX265_008826 [Neoarthrinium moseri]|uniref:Uncharacterized protein n=1 Tax=Neoarthrinium moseri TaxID=1658444 RepID=A0A9P9WHI4_9PEZI|nr:uncharacterized protein JN550_009543 [Neoarthrinium moseri]KAI1848392.1 hypothetical protein JX266_005698 [Neoarthrinium moseri]KAI1863432.1 hypothetical protein JN550_009543 [Neoarthrinium moseri]KAI1863609.1 hypothetical protein JX265_008826 [Neoarthrinium moseri]
MSKPAVSAQLHILKALNRWPKDSLRPAAQLQDVLKKRFEGGSGPSLSEEQKLKQANALYSLLDNRFRKRYAITGEVSILKPRSNPTYYTDLLTELQDAPTRSWLQRFILRVKGVVRLQ